MERKLSKIHNYYKCDRKYRTLVWNYRSVCCLGVRYLCLIRNFRIVSRVILLGIHEGYWLKDNVVEWGIHFWFVSCIKELELISFSINWKWQRYARNVVWPSAGVTTQSKVPLKTLTKTFALQRHWSNWEKTRSQTERWHRFVSMVTTSAAESDL